MVLGGLAAVALLTLAVSRILSSDVARLDATEVPTSAAAPQTRAAGEPPMRALEPTSLTVEPVVEIEPVFGAEPLFTSEITARGRATTSDPIAREHEPAVAKADTARERVRHGDTLEAIFSRLQISRRELHNMLAANDQTRDRLEDLEPGQEIEVRRVDGSFASLDIDWGPLESLSVVRDADGSYHSRLEQREPERVRAYRHGSIERSLFLTGQGVGLTDDITLRLAQIFQWDIDFVLDIRKGDEFHLLFNELYVEDEFIGFGEILAAEFVSQGRTFRAVRFEHDQSPASFFTPDGKSMRKAFLRAPLDFTRISSNFNPNRVHPLWKHSMPHRGIDYAAHRGTPVYAAGDGKVVTASRTKPNGNYVVIQHGETFETKYLHLSKFGPNIRSGRRVSQGDVIGYVGSTGWATGPHLHYEFLVNGVHKNPRTVELPKALPVAAAERDRFDATTSPLLTALESEKTRYATVEITGTAGD